MCLEKSLLPQMLQPGEFPSTVDQILQDAVEDFTHTSFESLAALEERLEQIKTLQDDDVVTSRVNKYVSTVWPKLHILQVELKPYWNRREELHIYDNPLLKGSRIVIPPALRDSD